MAQLLFILALFCAFSPICAAQTTDPPALRITRSHVRLNPGLMRAFSAYETGDLAAADAEYRQVLRAEPNNAQALHGAAAVALRRKDRSRAADLYRRAVSADPRDAVAHAGLAGLYAGSDPLEAENRLKILIAAQPEESSLHFALGNLHAAAGRWHDAQRAFFSAYSGDPEQPDYLFNLAVSLDHLRQGKLARQYYEKALALAARRPAGFDPAQAATRLESLPP
jgi:Tfp pilus assembly protein PilF